MTENQINQLKTLKELLDGGALTKEEFEKEKSRIIGNDDIFSSEPTKNDEDEPKQLPSKNVIIICAVAVVVVVGGFFGYTYYNNQPQVSQEIPLSPNDTIVDTTDIPSPEPVKEVAVEGKNLPNPIKSDNSLTLDDVFCDQNVGKEIDLDYNKLTNESERKSKIGDAMANAHFIGGEFMGPRTYMTGRIEKYKGKTGVYCCEGSSCAGAYCCELRWIYDRNKKTLYAQVLSSDIPSDEESDY